MPKQSRFSERIRGWNCFAPLAMTGRTSFFNSLLNSERAVEMSVFVVRAFLKMRDTLATNKALAEKLAELEKKLTSRLDVHEKAILHILSEIKKLTAPIPPQQPKRRPIGFRVEEPTVRYRINRMKMR